MGSKSDVSLVTFYMTMMKSMGRRILLRVNKNKLREDVLLKKYTNKKLKSETCDTSGLELLFPTNLITMSASQLAYTRRYMLKSFSVINLIILS